MKSAYLAILAITLACCASSPEKTAWNMANEVNTPAAYQDFIRRYPDSGYADDAREKAGKSMMDQVMKAETLPECFRIMKTNPDPKIAAAVADVALKIAQNETSVDALYEYLAYFKGHGGAAQVRLRLEELEFNGASKNASPEAMEYFLFRYPQSRFASEGQMLFSEKSYGQVKTWANQFGFKAFLQRFPGSPHAAEVRGWIKPVMPSAGSLNPRESLGQVAEKSPWLKRYACALTLSSKIKKNPGDLDSLRHELYVLEKEADSEILPGSCASMTLAAKTGAGESLDEALRMLAKATESRKDLESNLKVYGQRDEMARTAVGASSKIADELETAELSEDVLGNGPLGGMDVGREKGSVSARKALERFQEAEKMIEKGREDIKRLLLETDGLYKPLQLYVTSCLAAD